MVTQIIKGEGYLDIPKITTNEIFKIIEQTYSCENIKKIPDI